ncbi:hypothetical protein PoB_000110100 [Plakobranchus ocellatus]|uniref:Uncharacterized protein n=1 Tax=Plakobranchus ocellatus TaxID=259542 RepID=A0AAV3XUW7_9GAST|nr:hypothetical protein PoB_000110100 [Plakobranchus ocellatus]
MYTSQPEAATVTSSYAESTKYVADILSSMANGGVETPTSFKCRKQISKPQLQGRQALNIFRLEVKVQVLGTGPQHQLMSVTCERFRIFLSNLFMIKS